MISLNHENDVDERTYLRSSVQTGNMIVDIWSRPTIGASGPKGHDSPLIVVSASTSWRHSIGGRLASMELP